MQNKGLVKLFALLFGLVSIFQLSFTFKSNQIENKANEFAINKISGEEIDFDTIPDNKKKDDNDVSLNKDILIDDKTIITDSVVNSNEVKNMKLLFFEHGKKSIVKIFYKDGKTKKVTIKWLLNSDNCSVVANSSLSNSMMIRGNWKLTPSANVSKNTK